MSGTATTPDMSKLLSKLPEPNILGKSVFIDVAFHWRSFGSVQSVKS